MTLLKRVYMEQGRPAGGLVCPPRGGWGSTGLLNTGWLSKRASRQWAAAGLQPITLQEARHTAATWLDAAGVPPKIASVLMGHATPERQPGAAQITLARYTHALPEDIEKARAKLAAYLLENQPQRVAVRMTFRSLVRSPETEGPLDTGDSARFLRSRKRYGRFRPSRVRIPPSPLDTHSPR